MVRSKDLKCHMLGLKPKVGPANEAIGTTMQFKQLFLTALIETYRHAKEIRIYEDRANHVTGFRAFFREYNVKLAARALDKASGSRGPVDAEVIPVLEDSVNLDPTVEVALVQRMIDEHNAAAALAPSRTIITPGTPSRGVVRPGVTVFLKKTSFFLAYAFSPASSRKLIAVADDFIGRAATAPMSDVRMLANNIVITARPAASVSQIIDAVGGLGARMRWEVTGLGSWRDCVWAARLRPVPANAVYHVDSPVPIVVLALKRTAKSIDASRIVDWAPPPPGEPIILDTVVREKVVFRIDPVDSGSSSGGGAPDAPRLSLKRKLSMVDDSPRPHPNLHHQNTHLQQQSNSNNNSSRGRGPAFRGRGGSGPSHANSPKHSADRGAGGHRQGGGGGGGGATSQQRGGSYRIRGQAQNARGHGRRDRGDRAGGDRDRGGGDKGPPYGYRSLDDVGRGGGGGDGGGGSGGIDGYY